MLSVGFWRGSVLCCFFFNDTATTEIYTLSLHDALPILALGGGGGLAQQRVGQPRLDAADRKSTRLNSSHQKTSYAVFCLKKKKQMATARWTLPEERVVDRLEAGAGGG